MRASSHRMLGSSAIPADTLRPRAKASESLVSAELIYGTWTQKPGQCFEEKTLSI
jgi:hypothetical protein